MTALIVFLLFLTTVVCPATADDYERLDPGVKKFVDLALIKANGQFNYGHLNFYSTGTFAEVTPLVKIDVRLRTTTCRKAPGANGHRPECPFKQLEIRCIVCSADPNTSDPYIDCVRKKDQMTRYAVWDQYCSFHLNGQHIILALA